MTKDCVHSGHRERMTERFISSPQSFSDHELLELLLYYSIPRIDTNVIAHELLSTFGSISGVLSASAEQLMQVKGIGKKTAASLTLNGLLIKKIKEIKPKITPVFNFYEAETQLINYFGKIETEKAVFMLFDKNYKELAVLPFGDYCKTKVNSNVPELTKAIIAFKPAYLILSHTHPSGDSFPSRADDIATAQVMLICQFHNVKVMDHVIISEKDSFSYYHDGRLNRISKKINTRLYEL